MQDILNTKKFGDIAFRDKDFKNAIEYYSKVDALFHFSLNVFDFETLLLYTCNARRLFPVPNILHLCFWTEKRCIYNNPLNQIAEYVHQKNTV